MTEVKGEKKKDVFKIKRETVCGCTVRHSFPNKGDEMAFEACQELLDIAHESENKRIRELADILFNFKLATDKYIESLESEVYQLVDRYML